MKKIKAVICAALSLCVISVPLSSSVVFNAGAEEDVASLQNQIAELEKKNKEYQDILDQTETDISEKEAYSEALVGKINVINEKIILTRKSISDLIDDINNKQKEIDDGNANIESQIDALCERLRLIYMAGSASNLEILLGAKDFDDFVDKLNLVKNLSEYDKGLIDEINGKLNVISTQKKELETDKKDLEAQETRLNDDLDELNGLLEENKAVLTELTAKSEEAKSAIKNNTDKTSEIEAQIAQYYAEQEAARQAEAQRQAEEAARKQQAQQEAQQQQQQADTDSADDQSETSAQQDSEENASSENGSTSDDSYNSDNSGNSGGTNVTPSGGGYVWPCPGFYYLSSLWNEDRTTYNHGAIDIAGAGIQGATVVAAADGTVAYTCTSCVHNWAKSGSCGCGGGYGNYVWIDHGNGKETIYAHLTSVTVSPGQYVTAGTTIGYVGSTGYSTGPHLHFECRYNGVKYNPMSEY